MIGIKIVVTWHKNNKMFLTPDNVVKFTNKSANSIFTRSILWHMYITSLYRESVLFSILIKIIPKSKDSFLLTYVFVNWTAQTAEMGKIAFQESKICNSCKWDVFLILWLSSNADTPHPDRQVRSGEAPWAYIRRRWIRSGCWWWLRCVVHHCWRKRPLLPCIVQEFLHNHSKFIQVSVIVFDH